MSSVSLTRAALNPKLLAATLTLRPRQLALLASLEGPERMHLWAISRQQGKSTLAAMAAVHGAVFREDLDALIPRGRTRYALVAAPGQTQASEFVRLCEVLVDASPTLHRLATITRDRIDFLLPSGARTAILALPANSRAVRGMSASLIVLDEFAHFTDTAGPASDARMLTALEPTTTVFGDLAKVLICSTPFGESGEFYRLFQKAEQGTLPSARATQATAWEFDPSIDEAWRERKRAEVGDAHFEQEYAAQFVSSGGAFFDLRDVELEDGQARPEDCRRWVAGLDPAFHGDRFGVALVGESAIEEGVLLVGRVEALDPGGRLRSLDLRRGREDATLARVWELLEPYTEQGLRIVTDQHQSDAVSSYFGRLGVGVKVVNLTGPLQTAAFVSTRTRILDRSLRLWKCGHLLEDLRRVRARDTEAIQLVRYAGGHLDAASALALAVAEFRHSSVARVGIPAGDVPKQSAAGQDREVTRRKVEPPVPLLAGLPAWQRRLTRKAMGR